MKKLFLLVAIASMSFIATEKAKAWWIVLGVAYDHDRRMTETYNENFMRNDKCHFNENILIIPDSEEKGINVVNFLIYNYTKGKTFNMDDRNFNALMDKSEEVD